MPFHVFKIPLPNRSASAAAGIALFLAASGAAATSFTAPSGAADLQGRLTSDPGFASVSNPSYSGNISAASLFSGLDLGTTSDATPLTLTDGILVTSGNGAPPLSNTSPAYGPSLGTPGDADLEALAGVVNTMDAFALEFDFTLDPGLNAIRFGFMFGSEEYPEYVDSVVDGAAVIVDGVNWAKFPDNATLRIVSQVGFQANGGFSIEYDGISKPLQITALLDPNLSTHHVKIVIADSTFDDYDTGLFLTAFEAVFASGGGIEQPGSNTAPLAAADSYLLYPGVTTNISAAAGVLANDSDAETDPLTASLAATTTSGTLTLAANGSFGYAALDAIYDTAFTYLAYDGTDFSTTATASLLVRAPVWNGTGPFATGASWNGGLAPPPGLDMIVQSGMLSIGAPFSVRGLTLYKAAALALGTGAALTISGPIANEDRTAIQLFSPVEIHSSIQLP